MSTLNPRTTQITVNDGTTFFLDFGGQLLYDGWTTNHSGNALTINSAEADVQQKIHTTPFVFENCNRAIYIQKCGQGENGITLKNVIFSGNTVTKEQETGDGNINRYDYDGQGGALLVSEGTIYFEDSVFENNRANGSNGCGGAVTVVGTNSTASFKNVLFSGNSDQATAGNYGGGALKVANMGTVILEGCTFTGNTSAQRPTAGAIMVGHGNFDSNSFGTLILRGENYFGDGQTIQVAGHQPGHNEYTAPGSKLVFDLTTKEIENAGQAIINDFSRLCFNEEAQMDRAICIAVSKTQLANVYTIATQGADAFSGWTLNVQVMNEDGTVAESILGVSIEGAGFKGEDGQIYTLDRSTGSLTFSVQNMVFVNWDWTAEGKIDQEYLGVTYSGHLNPGTLEQINGKDIPDLAKTVTFYHSFADAVAQYKNTDIRIVGVDATFAEGGATSVQLQGALTEIRSGEFNKMLVAGSVNAAAGKSRLEILGGTFSSNVIGSDYMGGTAITENADASLKISGGVFNNAIAGGMYANSTAALATLDAAAKTVISGGTFTERIFGGNFAKNDKTGSASNSVIKGDVSLVFDCSASIYVNEGITAGSRGTGEGMILGNTSVTFTGDGTTNLNFGANDNATDILIWGGCNMDTRKIKDGKASLVSSGVTKERSLVFDNFTDTGFNAKIGLFSEVKAINESQVNFTNADLNTGDVAKWVIDVNCSLTGLQKNDFEDDVLDFYGVAGATLMSGTSESFANLDKATKVSINGQECKYEGNCWRSAAANLQLVLDNNSLKLAALA